MLVTARAFIQSLRTFLQSLLDYCGTIYDQAYNTYFHQKLEITQYNAVLPITGVIRGIHYS